MKYKVLRKTKKWYITPNTIFYGGSLICLTPTLICLALGFNESLWALIPMYVALILLFVSMIIGLFKFNKYKTLKGELTSSLEFLHDGIQIDDTFYALDKIKKISLENIYDYKGRVAFSRGDFDGKYSNGVDNLLHLYLTDGTIIPIHFQQNTEDQIIQDKEHFIRYCNDGKLGYLTLLNLLKISDYDQIQYFKKEYLTKFQ
ncbi:hypothetical protein [Flavobacterium sp. WV_118_3]|uniref:hypothetical protein n=1 Tax=Flavobacterium sp. WV_118_3 TaxID=3151764 RepID=UPI00321AC342